MMGSPVMSFAPHYYLDLIMHTMHPLNWTAHHAVRIRNMHGRYYRRAAAFQPSMHVVENASRRPRVVDDKFVLT